MEQEDEGKGRPEILRCQDLEFSHLAQRQELSARKAVAIIQYASKESREEASQQA
jgi:hypothetical protein